MPAGGSLTIGVMGGTFDPIHYGHLVAAEEVLTGLGLDRVIFVPSAWPPHKEPGAVTTAHHRYIMTVLATAHHPRFTVSALELERPGPSYTIDTITELKTIYGQNVELCFITGLDAVLEICTWKDHERLLEECRFIAVTRPGHDISCLNGLMHQLGDFGKRVQLFSVTALDISSSDLRRRVLEGKSIRFLLPDSVYYYIDKNGLYRRGSPPEV